MEKQVLLSGHGCVQVRTKAQFSVFRPVALSCNDPAARVGGKGVFGDTNLPILPGASLFSKRWSLGWQQVVPSRTALGDSWSQDARLLGGDGHRTK